MNELTTRVVLEESLYDAFVESKIKDPEMILQTLTPDKVQLIHMAMGIAGEAGELLDAIKKHCVYNKPLDIDNVEEELGDIEFFLSGIYRHLELTRDEVRSKNVSKLSVRYKKGYTDAEAQARADKS